MAQQLVTKVKLHNKEESNYSSPTGVLKDQVSSAELLKNPRKYFRTHGVHFANRKEIEGEISRDVIHKRKLGKKNILKTSVTKSGMKITFIQAIPRRSTRR